MLLKVLNFMLLVSFCKSQEYLFEDDILYLGDSCVAKLNNATGVCSYVPLCSTIQNLKTVTYCSFEKNEPLICCPSTNSTFSLEPKAGGDQKPKKTRRICEKKCQIFKSFLKKETFVGALQTEVFSAKIGIKLTDLDLTDGGVHTQVVGGKNAKKAEFPHMAILGWKGSENNTEWKCGGSLISENYVLTAAHCTSDRGVPPITVRLGEHDLGQKPVRNGLIEEYSIKRIIVHPKYSSLYNYNDIALIQFNKKITLKSHIRPACLLVKKEPNQKTAIATGWGKLEYAGDSAKILQQVTLNLFSNKNCNESYPRNRKLNEGIKETQICYGDSKGGKDTCQGDSGGPIQIRNNLNGAFIYEIVGITSFGTFCGTTTPGVYTRVSAYLDWIESVVWKK